MAFKIRFLLTSRCTATCAYCHNEGQDKRGPTLLSVQAIERILGILEASQCLPDEIILSGGEPTLHRSVADIARRCKATGAHISMDTHGGHPRLLQPVLPYLDEIKVHIDSFDAAEQHASMGIEIDQVLASVRLAQQFPLALLANHPLKCPATTAAFVTQARSVGLDCKIIDMFGLDTPEAPAPGIDWREHGYRCEADGQWLHANGAHRLHTKRCGAEHNLHDDSLFIGAEGIRRAVDGVIIGKPENFTLRMLKRAAACPSMDAPARQGHGNVALALAAALS
jgi:organic radical activating enzyme